MNVAIIPARGGSKRIPRKNVRMFRGKPMIAWSIEAADQAGVFDSIMVTTDDAEIADVARSLGAEVPFTRPHELSDDSTPTRPVINHAIEWLQRNGQLPDLVCCLYATAPFVQAKDLSRALELLLDSERQFAFSVTSYSYPIQRALHLPKEGGVRMFDNDFFSARSQDLVEAYHDAGQFYWGRSQAFLDNLPMYSELAIPVVLPRYRVQDIDTEEDWKRAELMHAAALGSEQRA